MTRYTVTNTATGQRSTMLAQSAREAATRARDLDEFGQRAGLGRQQPYVGTCAHTAVADDDPQDRATVAFTA